MKSVKYPAAILRKHIFLLILSSYTLSNALLKCFESGVTSKNIFLS
jgi:hypothetical protein